MFPPATSQVRGLLLVLFADFPARFVVGFKLPLSLRTTVVVVLSNPTSRLFPAPPPSGSLDREKRNAVTSAAAKAASDDVSIGGVGGERGSPDAGFSRKVGYPTPHTSRHLAISCDK